MIPRPPTSTLFPYTTLFRSSFNETILVVEDEDTLRLAVSKMLRMRGFTVIEAENGQTGVETARDRKSTRLNSSHRCISYAVFCLKKKKKKKKRIKKVNKKIN